MCFVKNIVFLQYVDPSLRLPCFVSLYPDIPFSASTADNAFFRDSSRDCNISNVRESTPYSALKSFNSPRLFL